LRKVALWDAVFYCAAQFLGAVAGVALASLVLQGASGADVRPRITTTASAASSATPDRTPLRRPHDGRKAMTTKRGNQDANSHTTAYFPAQRSLKLDSDI
jgi:hypothetical protein